MKRVQAFVIKALASCGYLSTLPGFLLQRSRKAQTGAGFVGSLAGLLSARWVPSDLAHGGAVLVGGLAVSVAVSDAAEDLFDRTDDPRIVIDEWIGYWVAVAFLPAKWSFWLAGFVLFRIFDMWKPLGIRRAGNLPGGWGVVMDDVIAGVYTNGLLQAARSLHWL